MSVNQPCIIKFSSLKTLDWCSVLYINKMIFKSSNEICMVDKMEEISCCLIIINNHNKMQNQ